MSDDQEGFAPDSTNWGAIFVLGTAGVCCLIGYAMGYGQSAEVAIPEEFRVPPPPASRTYVEGFPGFKFFARENPRFFRVHLDEDVTRTVEHIVFSKGFSVSRAEIPSGYRANQEQPLSLAHVERALFVTHDPRMVTFHNLGQRHCGILVVPRMADAEDIAMCCYDITSSLGE